MHDWSIGCEVRTVRHFKKDEVALPVSASAMVTPDLVEAVDAGRAVMACVWPAGEGGGLWSAFAAPYEA